MNIDDLENPSFNFNLGKLMLRCLQMTVKNSILLESVLETQIVLNKKIDGDKLTGDDEYIINKLNDILDNVDAESEKVYLEILQTTLSNNQTD